MKTYCILLLVIVTMFLSGCATSKLATEIASKTGESLQESADKGIPSAEQTIKAWPYISGLIKGLFAEEYQFSVTPSIDYIMTNLDLLAAKETLTNEEKGLVNGYIVRLESLTGTEFWNKYGISLFKYIKSFAGI